MKKPKLIRITTVPVSLKVLLKGQLKFMSQKGYEVIGVSSEGSELKEVSVQEGIQVHGLDMSRKITPIKDLRALWQFYKLCKKERPFIVHSHTPKAGMVAMIGSKLARVPHRLHTVAGLPLMEVQGIKRKILNIVEKITYQSATKVYPNSSALKEFIIQQDWVPEKKLKVLANGSSNGINTQHFSHEHIEQPKLTMLKNEWGIKENDFVFVFVGRLVGDKGINELVKAFTELIELIKDIPPPKLLLVGSREDQLDPLKQKTLTAIDNHPHIISVGYQNDVRSFFAMANVLTFPSYREGFPNVVMQAGAMGLPAIVSDINGCNEIIQEGENGLIVPAKDSASLRQAMEELFYNRALYKKLKSNAREMIVARYEQRIVWEAILKEYQSFRR